MTHFLLGCNSMIIKEENFIMLTKIIYFNLVSTTLLPSIYSTLRTSSSFTNNDCSSSIHSASIDKIYNIPMKDISRPLLSVLDENKVQSLMETIQVIFIHLLTREKMIVFYRQWKLIVFLRLMFFGMKHRLRRIIISLLWVVVIVGSRISFSCLLLNFVFRICRAHQRLNSVTIRVKLVRTTLNNLKIYFGSSLPNLQ